MLEQGDMPVNAEDLKAYSQMDSSMDYGMDSDQAYVQSATSGEDLQEGVSLVQTMYPHEMVRKNSDY